MNILMNMLIKKQKLFSRINNSRLLGLYLVCLLLMLLKFNTILAQKQEIENNITGSNNNVKTVQLQSDTGFQKLKN